MGKKRNRLVLMSRERIASSQDRARATLALEIPVEAKANRVRVIVLQHPQEPDKELGSAALLVRALENSELKVGLSWRNLRAATGDEAAIPSEWAVLYLGAKGAVFPQAVNFATPKGVPSDPPAKLKGILVLDGTWTQAKALWWRNSWLTKLKRIVLVPPKPSHYGNLRKEPRKEAVSTIESVALALGKLDNADLQPHLERAFQEMLGEFRRRRKEKTNPAGSP
jgi:DTW domain-containing protein YfiP